MLLFEKIMLISKIINSTETVKTKRIIIVFDTSKQAHLHLPRHINTFNEIKSNEI